MAASALTAPPAGEREEAGLRDRIRDREEQPEWSGGLCLREGREAMDRIRRLWRTRIFLFAGAALAAACLAWPAGAFEPPEPAEDGTVPAAAGFDGASGEEPRIGPSLIPLLDSPEPVTVIITLKNQPAASVSEEIRERYLEQLRANEEAIRSINRKYTDDRRPANPEEAAIMARQQARSVSAADRKRIRELNEQSQALKHRMRLEIMERLRESCAADHAVIADLVRGFGGTVIGAFHILNCVSARVPATAVRSIAEHPLVASVTQDQPDQAHLDVSAPATGAPTFWNAGETGGVWWNATCDTGVDTSHPALSGKTWWQRVFHDAARLEPTYNDNYNTTDDLQGHGTHVAGIANSTNATYRGIAFGSTRSTNLKAGFRNSLGRGSMMRTDAMAAVEWGLTNATIDAFNLSFGSLAEEEDHEYARFWDSVVYGKNVVAVIAAGNDGPNDQTLSRPGIFYNGLCVANVDDRNTFSRADDVIADSSSRGPTLNGRKKPDICAPGSFIFAPAHDWEGTNPDYVEKSGTSMAAPHVCGGAILLHDAGIHNPMVIKAILINTADFIQGQTSWSNAYGWGYMNLDAAYLRRTDWFLHTVTPRNTPGWYRLYKVPNAQIGDKTTMVWNRRVDYRAGDYPTVWYTLSDLNLRYYRESNNAALALSSSGIDNVEQVVSGVAGPLVIRAYAWSTSFAHPGVTETYALAVPPGTVTATGPLLSANAASSTYTPPLNANFQVRVRLNNTGDLAAHNCVLTLNLPSGVSLVSGSLANNVGTVAAGASSDYIEVWLKATTAGTKTVTLTATSSSYGIDDWSGSGSFTVTPGPPDTVAPYTVMPVGEPVHLSGGTELVANGGFESSLAGWVVSGAAALEYGSSNGGSSNLKLGPGSGSAHQTVDIGGAATATLSFYYKIHALLAGAGCRIRNTAGETLAVPFSTAFGTVSTWTRQTIDISRFINQTVQIQFYSSSSIFADSTLWVDDVSVTSHLGSRDVWVTETTPLSLVARDDNSGIQYTEYRIGGGAWKRYDGPFTLADGVEDYNPVEYYSVDHGGNVEPKVATRLYRDSQPPKSILNLGWDSGALVLGGVQKATNGGFESGLTGWNASGAAVSVASPVHSGSRAARLGKTGAGSIYQDIPIDASAERAFLSFWVKREKGENGNAYYTIADPVSGLYCMAVGWASDERDWYQMTFDVTGFRGSSIRVSFGVHAGTDPATLYVDDVRLMENGNAHMRSGSFYISSADGAGVRKWERSIDSGDFVDGRSFWLSGEGQRVVRYRALDWLGHQEAAVQTRVTIDESGPTGSILINGGSTHTASRNVVLTLSATDATGVSQMRIRSDAGVWGPWQPFAATVNYTLVTAGSGEKTLGVEFQDLLLNTGSVYTDSIVYSEPVPTGIAGAKMKVDGSGVSLAGKVVTALFPSQGCFYISEPDRTAGIRVRSSVLPSAIHTFVDVTGVMATSYAEREIVADTVVQQGPASPIRPLGLRTGALGGGPLGYQTAVPPGASGVNNIGLLVRTWGRVTRVSGSDFYLDDGCGVRDSYPRIGVLVRTGDVGVTPPPVGQYVEVTGISGASTLGGVPIRLMRPRSASDIRVLEVAAAFVFDSDLGAALQFKSLLDSQGATTELVPYAAVETADWSRYHVVLIGDDTGSWTAPARVAPILGSRASIIGIGQGGTRFLDAVTAPDLYIGWLHSAIDPAASNGVVFGGDIYTYPWDLFSGPGANLRLFNSGVLTVALHDPAGASQRILQHPSAPAYFPVASEAGRFYQWGYAGPPSLMSTTGRNLFTNLVFRAARP